MTLYVVKVGGAGALGWFPSLISRKSALISTWFQLISPRGVRDFFRCRPLGWNTLNCQILSCSPFSTEIRSFFLQKYPYLPWNSVTLLSTAFEERENLARTVQCQERHFQTGSGRALKLNSRKLVRWRFHWSWSYTARSCDGGQGDNQRAHNSTTKVSFCLCHCMIAITGCGQNLRSPVLASCEVIYIFPLLEV